MGATAWPRWVAALGQPRHIFALRGRQISARHLARVAEVVAANRFLGVRDRNLADMERPRL